MNTRTLIRAGALAVLCATLRPGLAQTAGGFWEGTNGPPLVRIVSPQEGQDFLVGREIHICAVALNFTDRVASVEFLAGTNVLGVVTNGLPLFGLHEDFACFTWSNAAPGAYKLTAEATDVAGNSVTSAPVEITVVTDLPPVVRIVKPRNNAFILGPTNIMICASAFDPDGKVVDVAFFEGTNLLGVVSNSPTVWITNRWGVFPIQQSLYCLTWSNVPPGSYSLTAEATDNAGLTSTSAVVDISVVTNLPPVVRLVSPENGARIFTPADISICAAANDPDGTVTRVEFFSATTSLGVVTNGVTHTNYCGGVQTDYCFTWSNVPPASYTLTAVANDNGGATGTSAPVHITVSAPPPPTVRIVYPQNGAHFLAPANIYIAAVAKYFTNPVANVQFLDGTNVLGVVTNSWWPTFKWTNVQAGAYVLTAIATDTKGINATSPPVNITVVTNHPPMTYTY